MKSLKEFAVTVLLTISVATATSAGTIVGGKNGTIVGGKNGTIVGGRNGTIVGGRNGIIPTYIQDELLSTLIMSLNILW